MTKELAIRVLTGDVLGTTEQTQEAVKIAVEALSEPSGKDTIEREAVVEILHDAMQGCGESEENLIGEIVCKVDLLPSTQPEKLTEERTKTHACDYISRQDALDALDGVKVDEENCTEYDIGYNDGIDFAISKLSVLLPVQPEPTTEIQEILNYLDTTLHPIVSPDNWNVYAELHDMVSKLPPAKPEPLTDKEQRIFLAAIEREEKVCEEVDRNYVREPYEDSLMRVCKEIRRKVKGVLWT